MRYEVRITESAGRDIIESAIGLTMLKYCIKIQ